MCVFLVKLSCTKKHFMENFKVYFASHFSIRQSLKKAIFSSHQFLAFPIFSPVVFFPLCTCDVKIKFLSCPVLSVCPASSKQLQCDPSLCSTASCPGQKDAKCRVNPCGKCEAEFVNQYGQKVNCK